jgi:putative AlgH/UPF0301 family transcriptional regulator
MTSSAGVLREIGQDGSFAKSFIVFGYANRHPRQLDGQLTTDVWFTASQNPS